MGIKIGKLGCVHCEETLLKLTKEAIQNKNTTLKCGACSTEWTLEILEISAYKSCCSLFEIGKNRGELISVDGVYYIAAAEATEICFCPWCGSNIMDYAKVE